MTVRYAVLKKIQGGDTVPEAFALQLQRALLLALQEQGRLSLSQYRQAEKTLAAQCPVPEKRSGEAL